LTDRFLKTTDGYPTQPIHPRNTTQHNTNRWNLRVLFTVASALGGVACASSLFLLYIALDSWNPAGVWAKLGLAGLSYGQVTSMVYLKVSISDFLTLFRYGKQRKEGATVDLFH
jgi:H+-transporting ATPase